MSFVRSICALTLALLCACAREPAPAPSAAQERPVVSAASPAHAREAAMKASVACEGDDCPAAIGLLSFTEGSEATQCTAFLVAPDVIGTNAHCLPEDLRDSGANLQNRMWITFPGGEQIEASSVLVTQGGKGATEDPDFAFLRLAKASSRAPLAIGRKGMAEGEALSLYKVDPVADPNIIGGTLVKVACVAAFGTPMINSANHARSPVSVLTGCHLVGGNSGGPVVGADGSVRGVIFSYFENADLRVRFEYRNMPALAGGLDSINTATNFACLSLPALPGLPLAAADCEATLDAAVRKLPGWFPMEQARKIVREEMAARSGEATNFGWGAQRLDGRGEAEVTNGTLLVPEIVCVRPHAARGRIPMQRFQVPRFQVKVGYDRQARLRPAMSEIAGMAIEILALDVLEGEAQLTTTAGARRLPVCDN